MSERPAVWIKAEVDENGNYRIGGATITETHTPWQCRSDRCVIHSPTPHRMSTWPMLWRDDRKIVERLCIHGVGHPDPDQWEYWSLTGQMDEQVHGCCGCCYPARSSCTT